MGGFGLGCGNNFCSKAMTFFCMLGQSVFHFKEFSSVCA